VGLFEYELYLWLTVTNAAKLWVAEDTVFVVVSEVPCVREYRRRKALVRVGVMDVPDVEEIENLETTFSRGALSVQAEAHTFH
jgi:hypothetical protein